MGELQNKTIEIGMKQMKRMLQVQTTQQWKTEHSNQSISQLHTERVGGNESKRSV